MTMKRAYSILTVKSVDEEKRIIRGTATTPTPDRVGDIVEPMGAEYDLPMPLLWQHQYGTPVGHVIKAKQRKDGIEFEAQMAKIDEPGLLKDRLDLAWQSVKTRLVAAVSIGFRSLEHSVMEDGGWRFIKWDWLELSLVTIPANAEATIQSIKSIDRDLRAASGLAARGVKLTGETKTAGVTASKSIKLLKGRDMKTLAEQKAQLEATLAAKQTERSQVQQKALDEGRTKHADEKEQFDTLSEDITAISSEIKDIESLELSNVSTGKTVVAPVDGKSSEGSEASRSAATPRIAVLGPTTPPGVAFARSVQALYQANGMHEIAAQLAEKQFPDDARIAKELRMKAAVGAANTGDSGWAGAAATAQTVQGEFIEFLRPMTIVDKFGQNGVPALRAADFNSKTNRMTGGQSGYWVGEGKPTPLAKGALDQVSLEKTKVGSITVMSKEQLRFGSDRAALGIRDDLAASVVERMDKSFISPDAAVAGVSPAGLIEGLTGILATGTGDEADVRKDLQKLFNTFTAVNIATSGVALLLPDALHTALMLFRNALGIKEFPDLTREGGVLEGAPVIHSNNVTAGNVVAVSANNILMADDDTVDVEFADQASLEMLDSTLLQDGAVGTGTSLVSLFQAGLVGIKVERFVNWTKARPEATAFVTGAAWNS